jgi:hypothetical protein
MDGTGGPPAVRWEVTEDMIDVDRWAAVYVELTRNNNLSNVTRWGMWPFVGVPIVLVVFLIEDPVLAVVPLMIGAIAFGLVIHANRNAAQRMPRSCTTSNPHMSPSPSQPTNCRKPRISRPRSALPVHRTWCPAQRRRRRHQWH